MSDAPTAARAARAWLQACAAETPEARAYADAGVALCGCIEAGEQLHPPGDDVIVLELPAPAELIAMDRAALLELSRVYGGPVAAEDDRHLAVAQLAVSFARLADLQAVAALLRLGAGTAAGSTVAAQAWSYLYDQQQPDGSFGLMAPELALLDQPEATLTPRLAMTVEVLWALAASTASLASTRSCSPSA